MTYTKSYKERKTFVKYDDETYALFLGEAPGEVVTGQRGKGKNKVKETEPGYSYTGTSKDGSTRIHAKGVTDENRRAKFIAGLIGLRYDMDAQVAILANGSDTPAHTGELAEFNAVRRECKAAVDELLNR